MNTKLIELQDGVLVEVDTIDTEVQQIAGGLAEKVSTTLGDAKPILINLCNLIADSWAELNKKAEVEQAEIEFGVSYEGEGNLYVTKLKGGANLNIKLTFKPKPNAPNSQ